jgi:LDH2 family malate/lactate/ureidoglycolate dehydrogenase
LKVKAKSLGGSIIHKLVEAGLTQTDAELVTDSIMDAEKSKVVSHGLVRFPVYLKQIKDGVIEPSPKIIIEQNGSIMRIDGGNGPGIVVASLAMSKCIEGAKKWGICAASVLRSNHFGAAAYFTRMAARDGCIGFVCSVAGPTMAPFGGMELLLGTDPFSVSFPYADKIFTIDIASSAAAKGKIREYARHKKEIPQGWALDSAGSPTTDAKAAIDGILLPMGGHKGYGIALVVEMLSAILGGSKLSFEATGMLDVTKEANIGHFVLAIDIEHFISLELFKTRAGEWLKKIESSKTSCGVEEIMIPGWMEEKNRQLHTEILDVDDELYQQIISLL